MSDVLSIVLSKPILVKKKKKKKKKKTNRLFSFGHSYSTILFRHNESCANTQ